MFTPPNDAVLQDLPLAPTESALSEGGAGSGGLAHGPRLPSLFLLPQAAAAVAAALDIAHQQHVLGVFVVQGRRCLE